MPFALLLLLLQQNPVHAKDKLFPSPMLLPAGILEQAHPEGDPREHYPQLKELIAKQGAQTEFVLGKSDLKFLGISPALWSKSFEHEEFSLTDSFGRMLCKDNPKNKAQKPLLIVRADEPGDTLLHEFLHFLQSKRSVELCRLYGRLEKAPSDSDLRDNLLLEYEVARFLKEEVPFASGEVQLALIEKLLQFATKLSDSERKRVDKLYGWETLQPLPLSSELTALFTREGKAKTELAEYKRNSIPESWGKSAVSEAKIQGEFSLLSPFPFQLEELPLCLKFGTLPPKEEKLARQAMKKWNESAQKTLQKNAFRTDCTEPKADFFWDEISGKSSDGILKFGELKVFPGKSVVLVRKREWTQYDWMVSGLIRRALTQKKEKERKSAAIDLAVFKEIREAKALENFFLHELGHLLGLGHNFAESSVMNYSSELHPTAYDEAALACRFREKCSAAGKFQLSLKPKDNETFVGD